MKELAAMELARETPEICFQEVGEAMGMELIEAVRSPERATT